jgi:diguanylate cyclase (GGDEF)-like protein
MFKKIHLKIIEFFSPQSPVAVQTLSLALLCLLGWIDHATGDYSLIIFYLIPVSLVAWFVGKRNGLIFCILAVAIRAGANGGVSHFALDRPILQYWNDLIELVFLLIMSQLFSALRTNLDNEKCLSSRDPLTNALNRRSFFELAEYEVKRSNRYSLPFTVAYIDLDNFKAVNDQFGHEAGDKLLITVVNTFDSSIRSTDIISRFGGDEFVILLPETSGEAAVMLLNKIHEHLNFVMRQNNWPVSISIGAASYSKAPATADEAIQKADELMYVVKRNGKNSLLHQDIAEGANG